MKKRVVKKRVVKKRVVKKRVTPQTAVITALMLLALLLAGCGGGGDSSGGTTSAPASGTFSVTVSGAVLTNYSGSASYVVSESEDLSDISLILSSADGVYVVSLSLPGAVTPGTYAIDPSPDNATSPILSFAQTAQEGENAGEITVYNGSSGQITLDSTDPMTGRFEFIGQTLAGETVGVNGTFTGLPRSTNSGAE